MSQYYTYVYEVMEVIGEDEREITAECRTEDHKIYLLIDRAAFSLNVTGWAWAEKRQALAKKAYPEREYTHRRIRLLLDPDPPYAV